MKYCVFIRKYCGRTITANYGGYLVWQARKNNWPLRVAAQRQRELMCILSYADGIEEQKWLDQQDVITDQFHPVPTTTLETGTPIISTSREPLWRIVK